MVEKNITGGLTSKKDYATQKKDIYESFHQVNPKKDINEFIKPGKRIVHISDGEKEYKYCSKCSSWKSVNDFFNQSTFWDKLDRLCKICKKGSTGEATKKWKKKNKEYVQNYQKEYEDEHQDQRKEYNCLSTEEKTTNEILHKKKYFKEFTNKIIDKDGQAASNWVDYEDAHTKLWVKCVRSHHFEITPSNLNLNKWCPICSGKFKVKECSSCRRNLCGSTDYFALDNHAPDKLKYTCKLCSSNQSKTYKKANVLNVQEYNAIYRENNKEKIQSYYKVSDEQKEQNIKTRKTKYFNKFKELAEQRGGTCLSNESDYDTAHTKLKLKCQDSHEFEITPNNLSKSRWCSHCCIFYGEEYSRYIMEYFFDCPFVKQRPAWLINKNKKRLELDGYNKDKAIAYEYNGLQHYEEVSYFYKSTADFEKRLADDKIKQEECIKKSIKLLIIPYDVKIEVLPQFIYDGCLKLGLKIDVKKVNEFNTADYKKCISHLEKVKKLIHAKEGILTKGVYINNKSKMTIKCSKDHEFETTPRNLRRNIWCPTCGLNVTKETSTKISDQMKKHFSTEEGKKQKALAHGKRSITMAKQREELQKGLTHVTCAKCNKNKQVSEFCKKAAAKTGYQSWCKFCTNEKKKATKLMKDTKKI